MSAQASIYPATAADIASNLGLPLQIIQAWVTRGDLPTLTGGFHDRPWATWLAIGRKATEWRRDVPVNTAVGAGWLSEWKRVERTPTDANLVAFQELFERNGFSAADAAQALEAARAA